MVVGENRWRVGFGVFVEFWDRAGVGVGGRSSFEGLGRRWRDVYT